MRLRPTPLRAVPLTVVALTFAGAAAASPLDDALAAMARADDDVYLQARTQALALTSLDEVQARRAALTVTDKTWQEAVALASLEAHLTPGAFDALHHTEGLDPAIYLKARRAEPAVARELSRANIHPGALAETLLKTADAYPFADDSAYPMNQRRSLATLRSKEESALRAGLMTALARSQDPAARYVLRDVLQRPRFGDGRLQAAVMIGVSDPDGDVAFDALTAQLASATDDDLRASIAVGLGKTRSVASAETLAELGRDDPSRDVRVAALRALGGLGSAWGLKARGLKARGLQAAGRDDATKIKTAASQALLTMLPLATTRVERDAAIDSLGMVADEGSLSTLRQLQTSTDVELADAARRAERRVERNLRRRR